GFTKWIRVALPMIRRLSRTVRAMPPLGLAPTTAIDRGANSGRRSMAGGIGGPGDAVESRSADHGVDAALLQGPGDDHPLDLAGALPDPVDAQLTEVAFRG